MSIDIFYNKHRPKQTLPAFIKSESQIEVERETYRQSYQQDKNQKLTLEIYELLRSIRDLEHPYTLEQLDVVTLQDIEIFEKTEKKYVTIHWKPPSPTCAYALQTGFSLILKLERELMGFDKIKLSLYIKPDSHKQKKIIDKQLNDKERVMAAHENESLISLLESVIS